MPGTVVKEDLASPVPQRVTFFLLQDSLQHTSSGYIFISDRMAMTDIHNFSLGVLGRRYDSGETQLTMNTQITSVPVFQYFYY